MSTFRIFFVLVRRVVPSLYWRRNFVVTPERDGGHAMSLQLKNRFLNHVIWLEGQRIEARKRDTYRALVHLS